MFFIKSNMYHLFTTKIKWSTIFLCLIATLSACAPKVDVYVANNYTDFGHINTSNLRLGYLFLWDRENKSIRRIYILNLNDANMVTYDQPSGMVSMSSSSDLTLGADVELTQSQKAALKAEVGSRTLVEVEGPRIHTVRGTITAMSNALNSNPNIAYEWELPRAVRSNGNLLYVLVFEITSTEKTTIDVDNKKAANATFESEITTPKGNVEFKIADASKIELSQFPAFARYHVFKAAINNNNNYDFETVTERYRNELIRDIKQTY